MSILWIIGYVLAGVLVSAGVIWSFGDFSENEESDVLLALAILLFWPLAVALVGLVLPIRWLIKAVNRL